MEEVKLLTDQIYARAAAIMADPEQLAKVPIQLSDGGFMSTGPSLREQVLEHAAKEILGDDWFWEVLATFAGDAMLVIKGRSTKPDPDPLPWSSETY